VTEERQAGQLLSSSKEEEESVIAYRVIAVIAAVIA
jgi:hypothetical protein